MTPAYPKPMLDEVYVRTLAQRREWAAKDPAAFLAYDRSLRLLAAVWRRDALRWSRRAPPEGPGRYITSNEAGAANCRAYARALYQALAQPMDGEVFVLRQPGTTAAEEWRVRWGGRVCSPTWVQKGPALAYLDLLRSGYRQPEYRAEVAK